MAAKLGFREIRGAGFQKAYQQRFVSVWYVSQDFGIWCCYRTPARTRQADHSRTVKQRVLDTGYRRHHVDLVSHHNIPITSRCDYNAERR